MKHFVVLGFGSIGRRHASNLAALHPTARFTLVRHRGGDADITLGSSTRVVDDLAHVLDDHVDLAVLATPSSNHIDALPTLIERGWPLLIEKPIVTDLGHCDRIDALLQSAPPAVRAAGFNLRHLPSIATIRSHIARGDLGRVVRATLIAGQWLPDWRPGTDYRTGYSASMARGGGVELDLSHEIDLARWFFGELNVDYARGGHFSDLEIDAHDTSTAMLSPVHEANPLVTVSLDYVARQRVRWYEVVGDRGRMVWDLNGSLDLMTADGTQSLSTDPRDYDVAATYVTMMRQVLEVIESGDVGGLQTLEDGLRSTRLALDTRDRGGRP